MYIVDNVALREKEEEGDELREGGRKGKREKRTHLAQGGHWLQQPRNEWQMMRKRPA